MTYDFEWKCTNPDCGEGGSCHGENKLYKVCPYCGSKVEVKNVEEYEA